MIRSLKAYKNYYQDFIQSLNAGAREKVLYGVLLLRTQDRLPAKYVKFIGNGLFELRVEWQSNIYRLFFCYDEGRIIVVFNCFQKKSQKTPRKELEKAYRLMEEYYNEKGGTV
ncbi:MAG: type II toxin-antitoxin system RelE/ParE family toxin [Tannerella sp.]|jgi:phage-related protein|nr:type II toxin-antitoxin system RelE/ParE family toxin [Tannerella sp.]